MSLQWVILSFCICFVRSSHQYESTKTESEDSDFQRRFAPVSTLFEEGPKCIRPITIGNGSQYDMLHFPSYLWPNGTIPYRISKKFKASERSLLAIAMYTIQKESCVQFVAYDSSKHEDCVYVRTHRTSCLSKVGRIGGLQKLQLAPICFVNGIGTIIHNLLHIVGFGHEHDRPDRDNYINFLEKDTLNGFKFARRTYGNVYDSCDEYDFYSIMHFPLNLPNQEPLFSITKGQIVANPDLVGQRIRMSRLDKKKLNRMYNCWNKEGMIIDKAARKRQLETYELLTLLCKGTSTEECFDLCQKKLAELKFCLPLIKKQAELPDESLN